MAVAKTDSDIMASGAGMSPRKAIASGMGPGAGDFGVAPMSAGKTMHPDAKAKTGAKGASADGQRGIGVPVSRGKGQHPAQAAPDHGPTHPGGYGARR